MEPKVTNKPVLEDPKLSRKQFGRKRSGRQGKGSRLRALLKRLNRAPMEQTQQKIQQELLQYESMRVLTHVQMVPEPILEPWPAPAEYQQSPCRSPTPDAVPPEPVPQRSTELSDAETAEEFKELNSSNAGKFVSQHSDILLSCSTSQWHKITIKTPVLESKRKFVIMAINKQISPLKLIPYFFRKENGRITFAVNMCGLALKTLCKRDLKVPYISDRFVEIEMTLKLFAKNFNLSETLKEIISRRLDSEKKFLDLSYINSIPDTKHWYTVTLSDVADLRIILGP